ncbi:MAG: NAD(P)/FAD-dependent oxidoreductase [Oscillospiraceae bacterium]
MLLVNEIRLSLDKTDADAQKIALARLRVQPNDIENIGIAKISVDARHCTPKLVYNVAVELKDAGAEPGYAGLAPGTYLKTDTQLILPNKDNKGARPIVCGFGPSGIFAALVLARQGFMPIVLERGDKIDDRVNAVNKFWNTGILNANSNIQYGEGGAGTFSDGKLTTRISDTMCGYVTRTFLRYGAPAEIAYMQKPHIGTDKLRSIIKGIRNEIISLGGEVRFNTQLIDIALKNGKINAVITNNGEIECEKLILATGHSARDTVAMLKTKGTVLRVKPFSVGFRVEHLQANIDKALYHEAAGHRSLPKGEYQLSHKVNGRCVYSFCMCPGGSVVAAASEGGAVVTNGMSEYARDGLNANCAIAVSLSEADFGNDADKAIEYQSKMEKAAFNIGGGSFIAPASDMASFMQGRKGLVLGEVKPTYQRGVVQADLGALLGKELSDDMRIALRAFDRRISGFTADDAILTGIETRTSSPIRLERKENGESVDIGGIYPCGEGAGYAGGIMSAAVDGIKTALKLY